MSLAVVAPYPNEPKLFRLLAVLAALFWLIATLATLGGALVFLLLFWIGGLFAHSAFIAYLQGNATRIGREQFPDLQHRVYTACLKLGIKQAPQAYLLEGRGLLNALATRFLGQHYLVLYAPIVDALEDNPDAIDFYIGHELGHIQRQHLGWRAGFLQPVMWLPLLGAAYRRAQEYSCDRYGQACCVNPDDAEYALAVLAVGGQRWQRLNREAFITQSRDSKGFWNSYHELISDSPWLSKRMLAVRSLASQTATTTNRRHPLALTLALLTPRALPGSTSGVLLLFAVIVGLASAIVLPQLDAYQQKVAAAPATAEPAEKTRQQQVKTSQAFIAAVDHFAQMLQRQAATLDQANALLGQLEHTAEGLAVARLGKVGIGQNGILTLSPFESELAGYTVTLTPSLQEQQVSWLCTSQQAELASPQCRSMVLPPEGAAPAAAGKK